MLLDSRSMWHISAVPLYIWCMLLLPSALVATHVAFRRRWAYAPIVIFSLVNAFVSSTESVYTVFVLKRFDDKFRHAPDVALELALFGDAIIGFIGLFFFGSVLAYCARKGRRVTTGSVIFAALFGGMYESLLDVLYWSRIEAPLLVVWIWILLMPVGAALLTVRLMAQGSTTRFIGAR